MTTAAQVTTTAIDKALTRAHKCGLHLIGRGYARATGARVLVVSSARDPVRGHVVTVQGARLHCDCEAAQYGRYCGHRALVHEVLEREAQQLRPAVQSEAWDYWLHGGEWS